MIYNICYTLIRNWLSIKLKVENALKCTLINAVIPALVEVNFPGQLWRQAIRVAKRNENQLTTKRLIAGNQMTAVMVAISYMNVSIQLWAFKFYSTLIAYNKTSKTVIAIFQMCSVTSRIVLHQRLISPYA